MSVEKGILGSWQQRWGLEFVTCTRVALKSHNQWLDLKLGQTRDLGLVNNLFFFFFYFFFYIFQYSLQDWRSEGFLRMYSLRPLSQTSRQQKPQWPGCEDKTKTCPLKTLCIKVASLLKHLNSTWAAAADGSCLSVNITEEWGRSSSVTAPPVCCLLFVLARLKIRDKRKKGVRIVRRMTHLNRLLGTPSAQF